MCFGSLSQSEQVKYRFDHSVTFSGEEVNRVLEL